MPMTPFPRYAVYYAPAPDSDLDRFGAHLLGYDAYTSDTLPLPADMKQAVPDWHDLTQDPRKYGFHATLKAPFSLAPGRTEAEFLTACERFAGKPRPIPVIRPVVSGISGFLAVLSAEPSHVLLTFAADCVREFDPFRAPLTAADRARRNPSRLSERQVDHLDRWGYPYVMEDFQFHMTLTGRLAAERQKAILPILQRRFAELELGSLSIDRIALFRQDSKETGFRIIQHYALA